MKEKEPDLAYYAHLSANNEAENDKFLDSIMQKYKSTIAESKLEESKKSEMKDDEKKDDEKKEGP